MEREVARVGMVAGVTAMVVEAEIGVAAVASEVAGVTVTAMEVETVMEAAVEEITGTV
jgi:hypothetical protein